MSKINSEKDNFNETSKYISRLSFFQTNHVGAIIIYGNIPTSKRDAFMKLSDTFSVETFKNPPGAVFMVYMMLLHLHIC